MVCLSIGYPTLENQMKILNAQHGIPTSCWTCIRSRTPGILIEVQNYLASVRLADPVLKYAIRLCEATRVHPLVELGISPRGVAALVKMARANAVLRERNYVVPEDVQNVFLDVCAHRLVLRPQARVDGLTAREVLEETLTNVRPSRPEDR
ncbi:MAG: AAA family ATPase [Evtepia sp.]